MFFKKSESINTYNHERQPKQLLLEEVNIEDTSELSVECKLQVANKLNKNIKNIEDFIRSASELWTGTMRHPADGIFGWKEIHLDTDLKNEMLDVLKRRKQYYVNQIQQIMDFK